MLMNVKTLKGFDMVNNLLSRHDGIVTLPYM